MKKLRRCQRTLILSLLCISVLAPIVLVSLRLKTLGSIGQKDFVEDLSTIKYRRDDLRLKAIHQLVEENNEGLKEPQLIVYRYKDRDTSIGTSDYIGDLDGSERVGNQTSNLESSRNGIGHESQVGDEQLQSSKTPHMPMKKEEFIANVKDEHEERDQSHELTMENTKVTYETRHQKTTQLDRNTHSQSQRVADEKIKEMKDQIIRAKAYLNFAPPGSNSHLVKELRLRIKEIERAVGVRTKDTDLSRSALQKMRNMETSLTKASQVYPDCTLMATKLRAMTQAAEEQVHSQKKQANTLVHLAARTTPKGLHCLSMRLTADYFALEPKQRQLPSEKKQQNLYDLKLHHYAVFSDNILACSVVVASTVSTARDPEKVVFHVLTDSLNFPAISMWFLLNPPGKATIQVQSVDDFNWLHTKYKATPMQEPRDSRFAFQLNHLRFYIPDLFPKLNKIVLFDHDVVVQEDLSKLWKVDLKGKVIGAVETCHKGDSSFRKMDSLINFSDPFVAKRFDINACTWAFGLNLFDLKEWRRQKLTTLYQRYVEMGSKRPMWLAGSLPLGWATFYNQTAALDKRWHVLGLGYDPDLASRNMERAAVIHYDGILKPWLEIAIVKYKGYWAKHIKFDHPYLQQCNIHE